MAAQRRVFERDSIEFSRAVTLIDAIFGFSLTLLVTTLVVPPATAWASLSGLLDTDSATRCWRSSSVSLWWWASGWPTTRCYCKASTTPARTSTGIGPGWYRHTVSAPFAAAAR